MRNLSEAVDAEPKELALEEIAKELDDLRTAVLERYKINHALGAGAVKLTELGGAVFNDSVAIKLLDSAQTIVRNSAESCEQGVQAYVDRITELAALGHWFALTGTEANVANFFGRGSSNHDPERLRSCYGLPYTGRGEVAAMVPPHIAESLVGNAYNTRPYVSAKHDSKAWQIIEGSDSVQAEPIGLPTFHFGFPLNQLGLTPIGNTKQEIESWLEAQRSKDYPGKMIDEAKKIAEYGPLLAVTTAPNVEGAEYSVPRVFGKDPYPREYALIRGRVEFVSSEETDGQEKIKVTQQGGTVVTLADHEIDSVHIDHPDHLHMPLNGNEVLGLDIVNGTMTYTRNCIESGHHAFIEAVNHPDYPGVRVVRGYRTTYYHDERKSTFDEVKAEDKNPHIFLITKVGENKVVVTSKVGYEKGQPVKIVPPRHDSRRHVPHIKFDMRDYGRATTDDKLLEAHLRRVGRKNGNPTIPIPDFEADSIFLYMISD
jgi:hypothetical protein